MAKGYITHGQSHKTPTTGGTRTYVTWVQMRQRCRDKSNPVYGGKGIQVCKRWESFENFLEDMGDRPDGMSIDRIDSDGNYEKSNCKWSSDLEQNRNKSNVKKITIDGVTKCIAEWSIITGIPFSTIYTRIRNCGWDHKRAITTPRKSWPTPPKQLNGNYR
jgi:hypothetical protein